MFFFSKWKQSSWVQHPFCFCPIIWYYMYIYIYSYIYIDGHSGTTRWLSFPKRISRCTNSKCHREMLAQTPRPYLLEVSMTISSFIRLWLGPKTTSSDFVDKQLETVEIANIQQFKKCISICRLTYHEVLLFENLSQLARMTWSMNQTADDF